MLTEEDIFDLLAGKSTTAGQAMYRLHDRRSALTGDQRAFLEQVTAAKPDAVPVPLHPNEVSVRERYNREPGIDLEPAELAWLQRLPLDPAEVTFDDAARLSALAGSISSMNAPASARLVESVWGPVRALHDERVAQARLDAARASAPAVAASTQAALVDALAARHPGVSRDALAVQAGDLISQFERDRAARRQRELDRAKAEVDRLEAERLSREQRTREAV